LNNDIIPRIKPPISPMFLQETPLYVCSVDTTPLVSLAQAGHFVPMLGGPEEIMPQHAVVPVAGTLEKVQQAFKTVQPAVDRGDLYHNPLDDGEIILP
jgi:hypothetical protein